MSLLLNSTKIINEWTDYNNHKKSNTEEKIKQHSEQALSDIN